MYSAPPARGVEYRTHSPRCAITARPATTSTMSLVLNAQSSPQHQRVFIELRGLSRFFPALRTAHVSHAEAGSARVDATHIFLDNFGFVSRRFNAGRIRDQSRHDLWIVATSTTFEQPILAAHPRGRSYTRVFALVLNHENVSRKPPNAARERVCKG